MTREALVRATVTALGMHNLAPDDAGSGLGWTARREYMVNDADTLLGEADSSRSPYIKSNDGWAICANTQRELGAGGRLFFGPTLISIDINAIRYTVRGRDAFEATTAVSFLGLTWYVNHSQWNSIYYSGTDVVTSSFPIIDGQGMDDQTIALMTLRAAGVRLVPKRLDRPVLTAGR